MRNLILIILIITNTIFIKAQDIYKTSNGFVRFKSIAPKENIEAGNFLVTASLNIESKEIKVELPITGFAFQKPLMKIHFNEKYLESHIFPKATFTGRIGNLNFSEGVVLTRITGTINIHGVKKQISENVSLKKQKNTIIGKCIIKIRPEDFEIKIPKKLRKKIAEDLDIEIELTLKEE